MHFKTTSNSYRKTIIIFIIFKKNVQNLSNCRYKEQLNYGDPTPPNLITKRKWQRSILWSNPLYIKAVKTKI